MIHTLKNMRLFSHLLIFYRCENWAANGSTDLTRSPDLLVADLRSTHVITDFHPASRLCMEAVHKAVLSRESFIDFLNYEHMTNTVK